MTTPDSFTMDYQGKPVRIIMKDGELWFVVADLCRILSIYMRNGKPSTHKAMARLRPSAKSHCLVETSCGPRLTAIVNHDGVSDLAFWAKHPNTPQPFVWSINEAMVSGRYETAAA
jgi:prophage antirepressor-like protein